MPALRYLAPCACIAVLSLPTICGMIHALSAEGRAAFAYWLRDGAWWLLLMRTLAFAVTGATAGLIAALLVALCLPRSRMAVGLVLTISCLPSLVPSSLLGVGWIMALGRDGVITNLLRPILGEDTPTTYTWLLAAIETGLRYFGLAVIVLALAERSARSECVAADAFGLSKAARLRIAISRLASPVMASWLLLFVLIQSDHILPGMFLIRTFGVEVLIQFNALMDPAAAAVIALAPAVIAIMIGWACIRLLNRQPWSFDSSQEGMPAGKSRQHALRISSLLIVLIFAIGLPLLGIVVRAGSAGMLADAWQTSESEVWNSIRLALLGSTLTVSLAIPCARLVVRPHDSRSTLLALLILNLALPASLIALGTFRIPIIRDALLDTEAPLLLAYAGRFSAVALLIMGLHWMRLPSTGDAAASVYDIPGWRRFWMLTVPPRLPSLFAATLIVMLLIAAELEISLILVPPGVTTLGVRLYTLIHSAPDTLVSALAVDVLLATLLVTVVGCGALALMLRRLRGAA